MTLEQLIAMGLTEEQAKKVLEAEKAVLDGNYVPKARFNEVLETKKKAEGDITERDKQLEELKKSAGSNEDLKKQIEALQAENKATKEKAEAKMKDLKLTTAIKLAIVGKAHDEELTAGLFDKGKLVLSDDGKVVGLDEQLKGLMESKAFLFKQEDTKPEKPNQQPYNPAAGSTSNESTAKTIAAALNKESNDNPYAKAWG